jgi:hypothetical protein
MSFFIKEFLFQILTWNQISWLVLFIRLLKLCNVFPHGGYEVFICDFIIQNMYFNIVEDVRLAYTGVILE